MTQYRRISISRMMKAATMIKAATMTNRIVQRLDMTSDDIY